MVNTRRTNGAGGGKGYTPVAARNKAKAKPKKPRGPRRAAAPKRGLFRRIGGFFSWLIWLAVSRGAIALALVSGITIWNFMSGIPELEDLLDSRTRGSVTIMDRNGEVFAWRGKQFGGSITTDTVAPVLRDAVVATEDKRFYRHLGVSPRGIASAMRINMREGRPPLSGHGGSTITQQVAKLICMGVPYDKDIWDSERAYEADCRESSMWRKLKEMHYAVAMELKFTKDEILTIYLNRAFLGAGAHGFEAAAQRYFGRSAAEVNAPQAAMLAGLLVAPTRYAPTNNLERSQDRAATVLKLMHEQGYITDADRATAAAAPATLSQAAEARAGGYFADWVMGRGPDFLTRDTTEDVVVKTTYDQRIQTAAEEGLQAVLDAKLKEGSKAQAAIVIMSADGAVRAMVGGRQFKGVSGGFNRAVQAKRQTGSAFKPFVYATALDLGWRFDDFVDDSPLTIDIPGSGPWTPKNYTRDFRGPVSLTEALIWSLNIPAIRVSEAVGRGMVRTVAESFGIESDLASGPALALGTSEASLLEMTGAYAGILNGGSSVRPYGLVDLRFLGEQSPLMTQTGGLGERVISPQAAQQLIYMMHQVVETGTGGRAKLDGWQVAGKTGTTNSARDAWFLGFSADYVAGIWMGYDDNTPLSGVTGGGLPAEIWQEVMTRVHAGLPPRTLPMLTPAQLPRDVPTAVSSPGRPNQGLGNAIENVLDSIFGAPRR
ncbi:Multimodular transpeptidase-transglycosylase [Candidatus Rhodobacter oscarellae]|uniref:peptidoglycan glycosyltransferase n=1 Tax=Candidatus Rhodobacter oscarellae TaxID=1675527 RepID=A0A0J9E7Q3_9RHOB|nr:Multimodular transpeptidase-transglycosylase [Candidatus Rhodobacter lobularis]